MKPCPYIIVIMGLTLAAIKRKILYYQSNWTFFHFRVFILMLK